MRHESLGAWKRRHRNSRIVALEAGRVTFKWKDYRREARGRASQNPKHEQTLVVARRSADIRASDASGGGRVTQW